MKIPEVRNMAHNSRTPLNLCVRVSPAILRVVPFVLLLVFGGLQTVGHAQTTFSVPFTYQIGGATPAPAVYNLFSNTPTTLTLVPDNATWVTSTLSGTTTPTNLTITIHPTGLPVGQYTSTLLVQSDQGTLTYNITLNVTSGGALTLSSSSFTFSAIASGTAPSSQTFTVTAQSSVSATVQTSEQSCTSQTWLSITPTGTFTASATASTFTVSVNQSGLAAGTSCAGTITFTTPSGTQTATVTLNVTTTAGNALTLSTSTLTFNAAAGGAVPASQTLSVTAQNSINATVQVTEQSCTTATWLTISPQGSFTAGATATILTVSVNQSGIAAGTTCNGTISFQTSSGAQSVNVTLNVNAAATSALTLNISAFNFTATVGGFAPPSQSLTVTAPTATAVTAQSSEQSCTGSTWLILSPAGGFTASSIGTVFTIAVNQTGIAAGTICTGIISFVTASGTQTASVTMNVLGSATPVLTLSTSALFFSAVVGGTAPPSQTFTVSSSSAMSATAQVSQQSCTSATWLSLLPSGNFTASSTAVTFTVSVNQAGMLPGTICNGLVVVVASSYTQTVAVTMVVATPTAGGNVTLNPPGPLSFSFNQGGVLPNARTVLVSAAQGSTQVPFTVLASAVWIVTNAGSGTVTTPYPLQIGVDPSTLTASATPYQGTVTITPVNGTQIVIPVSLNIAGSPAVSASPTSLTFSYTAGSSNPPQQIVSVSGGGSAAPFSVVSSNPWLHVSPTCAPISCVTPNTGTLGLIVTVDPTGLNAGAPYSGTITIAGTGNATGTTNVSVTLNIAAPAPAISLVTNGASFITGPVSPGEIISIFGNPSFPIGPATALSLSSTTCPGHCTSVPTTMGGVQVIFQPGGVAAPLTYVSSTQVNCVVPYEMLGAASGSVKVNYLGQDSNSLTLQYAQTQPGIFTALGTGSGLASVLQYDADGNYRGQNSSSNPAAPGWYLAFYATGEGIIPNPATTGQVVNGTVVPLLGPPNVLIDNLTSTLTYFAEAQGFVSGLMQVNAIIPLAVHTGQAVPLLLSMNGISSQPGVVIYIR